eukprot:12129973-Ditylum_brightwellii.AAC.1
MCGLLEREEDLLPDLFHLCAKKGQMEDIKDFIITEKLQSNKIYTDVDILVTQQLLKMIRQRKWAGGHPILMAATAPTGLSPYVVGPMTEEEVVNFNLTVDAIEEATHTNAAEIKSTKLKAATPADTSQWMDNIKGYINLVHILFGPICPHFFQMKEVCTNLQGLKMEAQNNIAPEAKAAILWIVLLQARHFTQGNTNGLAEFVTMQASLDAKNTCICHAELPAMLIPTTLEMKRDNTIVSPTPTKKPNMTLP